VGTGKRAVGRSTGVLAVICVLSGCTAPAAVTGPAPREKGQVEVTTPRNAAAASNLFGFDLFRRVATPGKNVIVSPISAAAALAMTAAGARGETLEQMQRTLHVLSFEGAHAFYGQVLDLLNIGANDEANPSTLRIADRVWAQKGGAFRPEFVSLLRDVYRAPLAEADFIHAPDAARDAINTWVDVQTQDRIPMLIGELGSDNRLVLVNAVYFKDRWASAFPSSDTRERTFETAMGRIEAKSMHQVYAFKYAEIDGVQMVELPYEAHRAMVVFLPRDDDGFPDVERWIAGSYDRWVAALKWRRVDLQLPRWSATGDFELSAVLKALGMCDAFDPQRADFEGMSAGIQLYISEVIQKTFVDADENGTEAAAATAVVMSVPVMAEETIGPPPEPVVFRADHPFVYVIRDVSTGAILFMGRVADPR
jgi:serpin B